MALFFGEGSMLPLAGSEIREALTRRLVELWGVGFLVVGLLLGLALISYDASDPSHFSASGVAPRNWLGWVGAVVADPLVRFVGLGAGVPVVFLLVWAWRFLGHSGEERIWARVLILPVALILAACFASTHVLWNGWPLPVGLGGMFGDAGVRALLTALWLPPELGIRVLSLVLGLATLTAGAAALGLSREEVQGTGRWMLGSALAVTGLAGSAGHSPRRHPAKAKRPPAPPKAAPLPPQPIAEPKTPPNTRVEPEAPLPPATTAADTTEDDDPRDTPEQESPLSLAMRALRNAGTVRPFESDDTIAEVMQRDDDEEVLPDGIRRVPDAPSITADMSDDPTIAAAPRTTLPPAPPEPEVYDAPTLDLLQRRPKIANTAVDEDALYEQARQLETVLADYGVRGEIVAVKAGPVVTLYELEPAPGLKASRVIGLADDIARSMSALSARVSTVPGRTVIGIELPNAKRETVFLREVFESPDFAETSHALALALGKNIEGAPVIANLAKMPHLLIAGTTGSGKSVAVNTMILSLLYRLGPEQCRLIMIDPKMLELSVYDGIPHLLSPVVTDPKKALVALKWVVAEMEERYRRMSKTGVRNIDGYNARVREALSRGEQFTRTVQTGFDEETGEPVFETETMVPEALPLIVVIVDEMADLMMVAGKEIEACIQRLAQMARASGIHLIMATQRPSVDVITGTIKANFPTRISFQVTSKIDSRTILGEQGAEQLLGQGDMLYMAGGGRIRRVHGPFVTDDEVEEVVRHLKTLGTPEYVSAVTDDGGEDSDTTVEEKLGFASAGDGDDALYDRAVAIVARDRKCSTSYIQRKLQIGYNKAARLVEEMEDQGVVSTANAVGKREILIEER